jgi:hypothetical protein
MKRNRDLPPVPPRFAKDAPPFIYRSGGKSQGIFGSQKWAGSGLDTGYVLLDHQDSRQRELPGYREFVQRVCYRLFPGIY